MAKCTGKRCPMQYTYNVDECNHTDCPYRTEPMTNADRIRAMSDEELAKFIIVNTPYRPIEDAGCSYHGASGKGYFEPHEAMKDWIEWLKQPAD